MIVHPTLQEVAHNLIKEQVLSGEFLPGDSIDWPKDGWVW